MKSNMLQNVIQMPQYVQAKVASAQPLVGVERDEITAIMNRIKKADVRNRQSLVTTLSTAPSAQNVAWLEDWQLPREALDYFEIERVA